MKANKKFISAGNLPPRISFLVPLAWWLVLERFAAPGWLYGVLYTIIAVAYVVEIWRLFSYDAVDLVGNDKHTSD